MRSQDLLLYALTIAILLSTYFRYSSLDKLDPYQCNAVLNRGEWLDPPSSNRSKLPYSNWQPDRCTLKKYKADAIEQCFHSEGGREAVFIGDSRIRQIFWAAARKVNSKAARDQYSKIERHADITFKYEKTIIKFIWDPYLNSSLISQYLDPFRLGDDKEEIQETQKQPKPFVVIGGGLWFARDNNVQGFQDAMDQLVHGFPRPTIEGDSFDEAGRDRPIFIPVQPPAYDLLDQAHRVIQPAQVNPMNEYMKDLVETHDIDVTLSMLEMLDGVTNRAYEESGLHVAEHVADTQADIVLNIRCNAADRGYPYDGTCCSNYPVYWAQPVLFLIGIAGLVLAAWAELQSWIDRDSIWLSDTYKRRIQLLRALLVVWACLVYCYLADRTHLLTKIHKLYNQSDFLILCVGIVVVGVTSIRKSTTPMRPGQEKPTVVDQPFMSRDQTDEWKGWMQLLILAYHYTGASKVLWVYKIIRLLVAAYLFMSGYGHAAYFYQKKDFSLKRVVAVMIRLNLLSLILPWMMNTDYMYYYFAPLVTYWYAIIYVTMRIKMDWNQQLHLFLTKIGIACAITTLIHTQPVIFEPPIWLINTVFGAKWSAREWAFRCALDQFIVYVGMVVSVLYIRSNHPPPPPPPPSDSISTTAHRRPGSSPHLKNSGLLGASIAALVAYAVLSTFGDTKTASNAWHPFISPLPVLAFVHLRNINKAARNHYSTAYAWIGTMSLETFILQDHIWLAADTKGLLGLGLFGDGGMSAPGFLAGMGLGRWLDCIVTGIVFILVSAKVSTATGAITAASVKAWF